MNYRKNKNDRLLRKKILNILKKLKIRSINFSKSNIVSLIGTILVFFTLFIPWIKTPYGSATESAFSNIIGINGYLNISIILLVIFLVFSNNFKQKIKLLFGISFSDYLLLELAGIFVIFSSLNSIVIISGLRIFSSEISSTGAITISLIGGICIFVGGLFAKKEFIKRNDFINLHEMNGRQREEFELFNKKGENKSKKNLKLPF